MRKSKLEELASLLDEHIERGLKPKRISRVDRYEDEIHKSLSHNPFVPHDMGYDSPYYNPYKMSPDGGFLPHEPSFWNNSDREYVREDINTQEFIDKYVTYKKSLNKLKSLGTMLEHDLVKGGAVPVGTVHTYTDGQRYKKVAEGKWAPLAGLESAKMRGHLEHEDPKHRAMANQHLDAEAGKVGAIQEAIKRKERDQKTIETAKKESMREAVGHMKEVASKMFDSKKLPKEMDDHFKNVESKYADESKDPKKILQGMSQELSGKRHHVTVNFKHNGKDYNHKFEGVAANSHSEAIDAATKKLKEKLPGAQVSKIHAESIKEQGEANA